MIEPISIRLEASSHCQLRCPACPTTDGSIDQVIGKGFLKADDFRTFLERNPSVRNIELSNYGEIFLNPQFLEILKIAHKRNVALAALNGVNLNNVSDEVLEALVKFRFREMTCSIDGASAETYRVYRVRGNFDRVTANVAKINQWKVTYRSRYPLLQWQFVVFRHNEHELPKARAWRKSSACTSPPSFPGPTRALSPTRRLYAVKWAPPPAPSTRSASGATTPRRFATSSGTGPR